MICLVVPPSSSQVAQEYSINAWMTLPCIIIHYCVSIRVNLINFWSFFLSYEIPARIPPLFQIHRVSQRDGHVSRCAIFRIWLRPRSTPWVLAAGHDFTFANRVFVYWLHWRRQNPLWTGRAVGFHHLTDGPLSYWVCRGCPLSTAFSVELGSFEDWETPLSSLSPSFRTSSVSRCR